MQKLKTERGVDVTYRNWQFSDQNSTPVGPIFENQNFKTLLRIYIYYMTILYRNEMYKIKTERGVDVTRKCDGRTDRRADRGDNNIPDFRRKCGDN